MTKIFILLLLFSNLAISQVDSEIKYFKDKYGKTEVESGPYMLEIKKINDSVTNHTFSKTKKGQKIWSKSYLGKQPYGLWTRYDKKGNIESTRDYNFTLKYGEFIPENAIRYWELGTATQSDPNNEKIQQHIIKHFRYPEIAVENGTEGRVTVQFTIDENGKVDNLSITEGADILLDTECFAIMNSLKQLEPYKKNGQSVVVYKTIPITFRLK
ncbi:energy transducer TonB [Zobellia galactanivorans]|uniref:TonB-like protein n=1 Tax=Zobellia galactanivorans (strain DSM 12802 / CCUG 47099 / CIP 106680 / NCIMB 13871 / Dsij) TaxID=63186 RepID=G0L699_ZOBGA|nr:TonB family protein [Zobellia galactanivorans]MBU3027581.1 energy transducer TonB [Zobellia galactanivorans]CAZ96800.1 TonB-like protein [Zobellia galactanivorans]